MRGTTSVFLRFTQTVQPVRPHALSTYQFDLTVELAGGACRLSYQVDAGSMRGGQWSSGSTLHSLESAQERTKRYKTRAAGYQARYQFWASCARDVKKIFSRSVKTFYIASRS